MMAQMCAALAPFPEKRLARAAGQHPKTAARWKRGETMPGGNALLSLMRNDEEIYLAVLRQIGRDPDTSAARQHLERALAALEGRG